MTPTTSTKLADAILAEIAATRDGRQAVSFLLRCLQQDGWRGLGPLAAFEDTCKRLGFRLEYVYAKPNPAWPNARPTCRAIYVTL